MTFVADFSWHAEYQRWQGCNPPVFLLWSLPLGQCAAHVSSNWLAVKMRLPWNMSRWSKWGPPPPQYPGRIHQNVLVGGEATCLWVCTCVHMHIKDKISRGRWAFEVKEEVGHVIVQPCVFLCAWVFILVPDFLQTSVAVHAGFLAHCSLMLHKLMPALSLRVLRRQWELIYEHFPTTVHKQDNRNLVLSQRKDRS